MGLLEGLRGAVSISLSHLCVEEDNLSVVNVVNKNWSKPWKISNLLSDAAMLIMLDLDVCKIQHCFREANRAADFMANKGHSYPSLLYWFLPYCIDFSLIIRKDVLGWPPDYMGVCLSFFSFKKKISR